MATENAPQARCGPVLEEGGRAWFDEKRFVEQPSGRFRAPQLVYCVGVVQAALFEALGGVPVWTIPSSAWKKRTIGQGNCTKPQVRAWVDRLGVAVRSQDEADAVCVAIAGRAMLLTRSWEASCAA